MDNLNALTDTILTIMSYNVQMLSVPLSNQLNLSTRQDAVIDYICSLDDLLNLDILVLNEVFTRNFHDKLTKGNIKDRFPYHTNVLGTKSEDFGKCSNSIVHVGKDERVGTSTKRKTTKKKAGGGKAPTMNDLNRKIVSTKKMLPEGSLPKVTTLGGATTREATPSGEEEASSLNSSDTNNNDQEEAGETLNLDSSDNNNRSEGECILSFNCGLERASKIKGKPSNHNYKAVPNKNERRNGADGSNKRESTSSDKEAQCSETDDGITIREERKNLYMNSRGVAGEEKMKDKSWSLHRNQLKGEWTNKDGSSKSVKEASASAEGMSKEDVLGEDPHANVDGSTKERRSKRNTAVTEKSNGDGKVSTQSYNNKERNPHRREIRIPSEAKTSIPNSVSSEENLNEKKWEGKKKKKNKINKQNITIFDSISGKSKFYQLLNGGVIILSKHPFIHKHALLYKNSRFPDMFCTKGAIYVKLYVNNKPVNVIATHLQAGDSRGQQNCRWKQLSELSNWVYNGTPSLHIKRNEPLFFVGDFNIRYDIDKLFFDKVLSSDCLNSYVTKKALETTYDSYLNDYCMHMERDYSFNYKYTLDYILVNNDSYVKTLVPQTAIQKGYRPIQIMKFLLGFIPYKCTHVHHPSDHFPIYATFKIMN
ncbi:sphingomyelin phosphodiesterase, putative [Plasmodium knowlesi strain H]|uniref:Sphingomyelin phosphodiesterase, putative n=3 Tax=Plasmodium knowlesi TaxID=5850 RepID=A0A5E7XA30_PLAKH|nr:sphingomyelin phosphodiesterase, putative [Plasmodium knowlesi strain H]OTN63731.1 putative Sphingomyelin phosphodiesterase [Plasmodium knowlesi]CAA9991181.1 sphingomyelin phosphodiesterase, putative [Plasmodium knowlesi strain H]SBO27155.1 sphingomyelin phosphodiesterase, putative [Plasmodium knowlesi strain H]SBO29388.1 sphingomyelin phosphodiesterase, putative [Plasmodium knowlesi strain H]VVS80655.1 sphingomyelin phosphodiesterase, putative [Plasmodium knowlesi strain H]